MVSEIESRRRLLRLLVSAAVLMSCLGCSIFVQNDGSSGDPKPLQVVESNIQAVIYPIDPMEVEDMLVYDLLSIGEDLTAHVVVRGTWIPGTTRCELYPMVVATVSDYKWPEKAIETACFGDFVVSDYIIGDGPSRVTLLKTATFSFGHADSSKEEKERWAEQTNDVILQRWNERNPPAEWILTLGPTHFNTVYSAWNHRNEFVVERNDAGEAIVVSQQWLDYLRDSRNVEIAKEHTDHLSWSLAEFERRAKAFHENRPVMKGNEWDSNHRIVTDIYDIHNFHAEDLKPYWEPRGIIPAPPPAAPGEPHSYPPVLAAESETGTEKLTLTEPSVEPVGSE